MPETPHLDRSLVRSGALEQGSAVCITDEPGVRLLKVLNLRDPLEFAVVNQWSGGEGLYRVGLSFQDADGQLLPFALRGADYSPEQLIEDRQPGSYFVEAYGRRVEAVMRHTVAYDFGPDRPPLRQYLQMELFPRHWGDFYVCLDINGVEVRNYPVGIIKAK